MGGQSLVGNLARACFECNVAKGRDIASYDATTSALTPLFNPRHDVWVNHFDTRGPTSLPETAIARVTERVLALNHIDQIVILEFLIDVGQWSLV